MEDMNQIEKIEDILIFFERGNLKEISLKHPCYSIVKIIDELRETPDKYLAAYKNYLEFVLPLLQRTTIRDSGDKPKLEGL